MFPRAGMRSWLTLLGGREVDNVLLASTGFTFSGPGLLESLGRTLKASEDIWWTQLL